MRGKLLKELDVAFSHKEYSVFQTILYLTFDSLQREGRVIWTLKCILEGGDSACITVWQSTHPPPLSDFCEYLNNFKNNPY